LEKAGTSKEQITAKAEAADVREEARRIRRDGS
jgi:hypothetical protein